ncbi:MAG: hypothetical protein H7A52_15680 [Akkermansiaceae bacterium]|nr:hypothetical protein [Akkermansiaceae bacterium]
MTANSFSILALTSFATTAALGDDSSSTPPRDRFLLLDSRVVASAEHAKLIPGTVRKHPANPLFGEDRPWEKRFDNLYGNIVYDAATKRYRCWYCPFIVDHSAKGMTLEERAKPYRPPKGREMALCYAESGDGIHWEKPSLGLVDYEGGTANNLVWRGIHGAGVFRDPHASDPQRAYKTIFQGLKVSASPDGLHWAPPHRLEGIQVRGDTHNNAFWAPTLGKYVAMTRTLGPLGRQVARIESADFVNWSEPDVVLEGLDKSLQTYAMPVCFHGGVYLGLVAIHAQPPVDRVWTELAWSPDTRAWHRVAPGTPLIPCSETPLAHDYGCVYACAGPVFLKDEIRLYYGGSDYLHFGWRTGSLCLATLRPDGFAGYEPESPDQGAVIVTAAIPFTGREIRISADVAAGGSVVASVVDADGRTVRTADPVRETVTDGRLNWSDPLAPEVIRLRFELRKAKLYSFSFGD